MVARVRVRYSRYSQTQARDGREIVQTRTYLAPDGRNAYRETLRIDPRTGALTERRLDPVTPETFRRSLPPGRDYDSLPRVERVR